MAQTMSISWPNDHAVFQYVSGSSTTSVDFGGQVIMCPTSGSLTCKIDRLNETGAFDSAVKTLQSIPMGSYGTFKTSTGLGRGWYKAYFYHTNGATGSVVFGVGDVYVIAGQSNASGFEYNTVTMPTRSGYGGEYDCIVAINKEQGCYKANSNESISIPFTKILNSNNTNSSTMFRMTPTGVLAWDWGSLGNKLANYYKTVNSSKVVPIAFLNTAAAGTSSKNWQQSAIGGSTLKLNYNGINKGKYSTTDYVCGGVTNYWQQTAGHPYLTLKNTLKYYASIYGIKAILWHQGEYDNLEDPEPNMTTYNNNINTVISQTLTDFPKGSATQDLQWVIAKKATLYENILSSNIQSAQGTLSSLQNIGPDTDQFTGVLNRVDNTHLNGTGLENGGVVWYDALIAIKPPSTTTKVLDYIKGFAASSLNSFISLSNSSANYTVQVAPGFSQYKWVKGSNPLYIEESAISTTNSYSNTFYNF
jgi:hypothetical protein